MNGTSAEAIGGASSALSRSLCFRSLKLHLYARKSKSAITAKPPMTIPAIAPGARPFPAPDGDGPALSGLLVVDTVPVDVDVALVLVDVADGLVEVGVTKTDAAAETWASIAGTRFAGGQLPALQGFCEQHPKNGGWRSAHVYHKPSDDEQLCAGMSKYFVGSKLE
jgi:hypothetical protein